MGERLLSVTFAVSSPRCGWRSTDADDHQRRLPIHPHGTLPPDPQIVQPVTRVALRESYASMDPAQHEERSAVSAQRSRTQIPTCETSPAAAPGPADGMLEPGDQVPTAQQVVAKLA